MGKLLLTLFWRWIWCPLLGGHCWTDWVEITPFVKVKGCELCDKIKTKQS